MASICLYIYSYFIWATQ